MSSAKHRCEQERVMDLSWECVGGGRGRMRGAQKLESVLHINGYNEQNCPQILLWSPGGAPGDHLWHAGGPGTSLCLCGGWLGAAGASRGDAVVGGEVAAARSPLGRGKKHPRNSPDLSRWLPCCNASGHRSLQPFSTMHKWSSYILSLEQRLPREHPALTDASGQRLCCRSRFSIGNFPSSPCQSHVRQCKELAGYKWYMVGVRVAVPWQGTGVAATCASHPLRFWRCLFQLERWVAM